MVQSEQMPEGTLSQEAAEALLCSMAELAGRDGGHSPLLALAGRDRRERGQQHEPLEPPTSGRLDLRYRALIESIPVVTFVAALDEDVQELYVSPHIERMLGFTQQEWLENPFLWFNQLHPEDRQRWQSEFARTCATGVQFRSDYRFIARDGRTVWVHGECEVVRDERGRPLFLQGVAFDITEIKRAQQALQQMHQELEAKVRERTAELARANEALARQAAELERSNAELAQFAYVASHDLKEPLRMIRSFTELLARRYRGRLDADADDFINFVVDGVARMQRLIDDLLAYSRVGRGQTVVPVDCGEALQTACANLSTAIQEADAQVTSDALPVVSGSPVALAQLFQNLIANALKFRSADRRAQVHISVERDADHWRFCVEDNGIGFDPAYADRIFMIFGRLHARARYPGTGMGLAICRKIVERHGGRIWADSQPGLGSRFYFTLPAGECDHEQRGTCGADRDSARRG